MIGLIVCVTGCDSQPYRVTEAEALRAVAACGFKTAKFGRYNRFLGLFAGDPMVRFAPSERDDAEKQKCLTEYLEARNWLLTR